MKKTIIKMKLSSRSDFIEMLREIDFTFSAPYWQHDRVFVPKRFARDKAMPRLSLRTIVKDPEKKATYALVMRRHFEDDKFDLVNATIVKDYSETAHILYQLGYELRYEVSRRREELRMGESVNVYIDKIDGLPGYYARIESDLSDNDNPQDAYNDILETFKVLRVTGRPVNETYGEILESSKNDPMDKIS